MLIAIGFQWSFHLHQRRHSPQHHHRRHSISTTSCHHRHRHQCTTVWTVCLSSGAQFLNQSWVRVMSNWRLNWADDHKISLLHWSRMYFRQEISRTSALFIIKVDNTSCFTVVMNSPDVWAFLAQSICDFNAGEKCSNVGALHYQQQDETNPEFGAKWQHSRGARKQVLASLLDLSEACYRGVVIVIISY